MMSVQVSTGATTLIAIDRFICIVLKPFQKYGFTTQISVLLVVLSWIVGAVLPISSALYSNKNMANSACILIGESLSTTFSILYICMNFILFIGLTIVYVKIMKKVTQSSQITKSSGKSTNVSLRLGGVLVTNFGACISISTLALIYLVPVSMPPSVGAIVSLVLFPLNSMINPLINTITAMDFNIRCTRKHSSKHNN